MRTLFLFMNKEQEHQKEEKLEQKFPDRKQDLDHRSLDKYMEEHKVRDILAEMIAYLVEHRSEDHIQGCIDFLDQYKKA